MLRKVAKFKARQGHATTPTRRYTVSGRHPSPSNNARAFQSWRLLEELVKPRPVKFRSASISAGGCDHSQGKRFLHKSGFVTRSLHAQPAPAEALSRNDSRRVPVSAERHKHQNHGRKADAHWARPAVRSCKSAAHPADVNAVVCGSVPLPTAGDNPERLPTATAAKGSYPTGSQIQPWITRIVPNHGLLRPTYVPLCCLTQFGVQKLHKAARSP